MNITVKFFLTLVAFIVLACIAVFMINENISKKNVAINVSIAPEITTINADIGKFKQILFNLLSNAIKFSPDKSAITIDVRRTGDKVWI